MIGQFCTKHTWNSTLPQIEKVQNGPSIRKTGFPLASKIENFGVQRLHSCSTFPHNSPVPVYTSMDWNYIVNQYIFNPWSIIIHCAVYKVAIKISTFKQHGKQQLSHPNGDVKWITSRSLRSLILMSNGRCRPQQFLVQQSVASLAEYKWLPWESLTLYLFFVSHPSSAANKNVFYYDRLIQFNDDCTNMSWRPLPDGWQKLGACVWVCNLSQTMDLHNDCPLTRLIALFAFKPTLVKKLPSRTSTFCLMKSLSSLARLSSPCGTFNGIVCPAPML